MKLILTPTISAPEPAGFRLTAKGYFGDMDETYLFCKTYPKTPEGQTAMMRQLTVFYILATHELRCEGGYLETGKEMKARLKEINPNATDGVSIPVDSGSYEMLPGIDTIEVVEYDGKGTTTHFTISHE